jgi:hypothetical protein
VWNKPGMDGPVPVPLANFTAQMVADITEDDVQSYGSRWDAIVRLSVPGLGSGSARVWLSKLEPGP